MAWNLKSTRRKEAGHIQIDFGLDSSFLHEEVEFTSEAERNVRINVQNWWSSPPKSKKTPEQRGRLLWSESEENLAQKLITRCRGIN